MTRTLLCLTLAALLGPAAWWAAASPPPVTPSPKVAVDARRAQDAEAKETKGARAEWTVLVFMNGDNNLEEYALRDFDEMAKVGSTDKVNILVQMDRIADYWKTQPDWTNTLRFRVTRGMRATPANALEDLKEVNMGDPAKLREFVTWGVSRYPARRYMLVIWDHGQGWKNLMLPTRAARELLAASPQTASLPMLRDPFRSNVSSPHRSVSRDDTDNDELYNSETASALTGVLGEAKLDVLGFDACLMAMVESAFAFRSTAKVMVASEDLEPGNGWQYDDWLRALVSQPDREAAEVGRLLVDSYRRRYATSSEWLSDETTTLSAIDLGGMDALAGAISDLSDTLKRKVGPELANLKAARESCSHLAPDPYGDGYDYFLHIDFIHFCQQLLQRTKDAELRTKLAAATSAAKGVVLANHTGAERFGSFGASGLAIYFPIGKRAYETDFIGDRRYRRDNAQYPVDFVVKHRWGDFLHAYFEVVP